jgi:hypothetical protein
MTKEMAMIISQTKNKPALRNNLGIFLHDCKSDEIAITAIKPITI